MNLPSFEFNLTLAWVWILLGFASGSLMGLNFKFFNIDWAGGYSGLRRRMYRRHWLPKASS
jgi:hypothetical protein